MVIPAEKFKKIKMPYSQINIFMSKYFLIILFSIVCMKNFNESANQINITLNGIHLALTLRGLLSLSNKRFYLHGFKYYFHSQI